MRWLDSYQARVLADRYMEVFLGDPRGVGFLVAQPLAVAACAGLVWQGTRPTPTLYFVLTFATIFFGCVNACREIVRERAIFQRERLVGLQIPAYIASKVQVLALLGFAQAILFFGGIRYFLVLDGSALLMVVVLYAGLLAGTALGLAISAVVGSDVVALALVPVCLIPQLLFSKLIMPQRSLEGAVALMEQATLAKWSYQAMEQVVASPPDWGIMVRALATLAGASVILVAAAGLALRAREFLDG
ncbi:MAG: ABC transporter permease [Candidatus Sericytochromatia bacterium]|nr:ABC transporter permease [Candidatus Sericytochromatia bacterium]